MTDRLPVFRVPIVCPECKHDFTTIVYPGHTFDRRCPKCGEILEVEEPPMEKPR